MEQARLSENYQLTGSKLEIVTYPDAVLKKKATEVVEFGEHLKELVFNMAYTMYHAPGIGLAAPQINQSSRVFVMDTHYKREETFERSEEYELSGLSPLVFINPVITSFEGETVYEEGCLSLPGVFAEVTRKDTIHVDYFSLDGNKQSATLEGLDSICFQHELDHLEGIVFIDHLSPFKKNFYSKKLTKLKRKNV